jgi:hypothetical protein
MIIGEEIVKKPEELGPSRFTFNGNIITEIGEESISNPFIAIAELIKNSYDADATKVNIEFQNLGKHNSKIIISDDGTGMDSSQIKDKWMDIGSPHKKELEKTSENNRIPVGAKGIGRFASHCLGKSLKLITASKNEHYGYRLLFDWIKFTSKVKATDVDVLTERFKKKLSTRGTTLVLDQLKHQWHDNDKLHDLLRDIYLLTSPINSPKNFKLKENVSRECNGIKKLTSNFLDKAAYRLKISLSKKKDITYEFYKNNNKIKDEKTQLDKELLCGDVTFDLYFYYKLASKWKEYLDKELQKEEIDEISTMLKEYGGIKLYRDKFRVKPYGDKDADWIGLDKWSRDQTIVPGNTQVIGVVSISKETNPDIEDTTTREGVINNPQFFDLMTFVATGIRSFVDIRSEIESGKAKARKASRRKQKIKTATPKVGEQPVSVLEAPFIDVKGSFPKNHYSQLIFEINECENRNNPNAAFWLCRKISENLIFDILEKKFPNDTDLWYDTANRRNHSFSVLIFNLYTKKDQFKPNAQQYIEQVKADIGKFKKDVDAVIHKNYKYLIDKKELKPYQINRILQLLIDIYQTI